MPNNINAIDRQTRFVIFSPMKKYDKIGTKTYPSDSIIGNSFISTPLPIAVMLMNNDEKNIR